MYLYGMEFEYAKRMMRLIDNENLRWLEEPVIADDIDGYADLKAESHVEHPIKNQG